MKPFVAAAAAGGGGGGAAAALAANVRYSYLFRTKRSSCELRSSPSAGGGLPGEGVNHRVRKEGGRRESRTGCVARLGSGSRSLLCCLVVACSVKKRESARSARRQGGEEETYLDLLLRPCIERNALDFRDMATDLAVHAGAL